VRKWHAILLLTLTVAASVMGYFAFQVLAALVAFFMYGSSNAGVDKWINVGVLFVVLQLITAGCVFYRKPWPQKTLALLLALLIPLGLFLTLEGSKLLAK
jgi:hypothetical protein